jgi:N-acetylmuramoyl-L-alanine amidase
MILSDGFAVVKNFVLVLPDLPTIPVSRTCPLRCKAISGLLMLQNSVDIWKMYGMQKIFLNAAIVAVVSISFLLCINGPEAEAKTDVAMRFSEHEGFSRIVFEAGDESFIKNINAVPSNNQLKIQFPSDFILKPQGKISFETSQQGKTLTISINRPFKTKILKLTSPPRLSIDILKDEKEQRPRAAETSDLELPSGFRVALDPGHGGYDIGIISGDAKEKDVALSVARSIENLLIKKNKAVHLTRKADQFLSITDRALSVNQKTPDVFISIHLSLSDNFVIYTPLVEAGAGESSAKELYGLMDRQRRYIEKSMALSEQIGKILKDELKGNVVHREMALPLLNSVGSASIMVEVPKTIVSDAALRAKLPGILLKGISAYANR